MAMHVCAICKYKYCYPESSVRQIVIASLNRHQPNIWESKEWLTIQIQASLQKEWSNILAWASSSSSSISMTVVDFDGMGCCHILLGKVIIWSNQEAVSFLSISIRLTLQTPSDFIETHQLVWCFACSFIDLLGNVSSLPFIFAPYW